MPTRTLAAPGARWHSAIYHTYSCYARGLDMLNGAYHLLDLVPKGRDEAGLSYSMEWLRHHDRYEDRPLIPLPTLSRPTPARPPVT